MTPEEFDEACERLGIPDGMRKHVSPKAPSRGKLAVARGMLPAPPKVLLAMQYVLLGDRDPKVAQAASAALVEMPEKILSGLIDRETHPKLLEFFAYNRTDDDRLMERVVLARQINDKTLCYLAECSSQRIAEMVAGNQERLIITPDVVRFLKRNPEVPASTMDRVTSFLRLHHVDLPEEPEAPPAGPSMAMTLTGQTPALPEPAAPALAARGPQDPAAPPQEGLPQAVPVGEDGLPADFVPGTPYVPPRPTQVPSPPPGLLNPLAALLADWGIEDRPEYVAPPIGWASDIAGRPLLGVVGAGPREAVDVDGLDVSNLSSLAESTFSFGFEEESDEFGAMFTEERNDATDDEKITIAKAIGNMTTGQKIKIAYKGNKMVREILVRDANKIVATAVVKSGRLTDNEVKSIAGNRGIAEDVLRLIAQNKEYMRKYPVKVAMAGNPKTPIPVAMSLLGGLHVKDLKNLANNRNVSPAVFGQATKLYKLKRNHQR